jgi:hypothetical protein
MDGDGDLDCPYSFDDKTGSSGNKTESSHTNTESSKDENEPVKKANSQKGKDYTWLWTIIGCFALYGVALLIDEIKWRFKK